MTIIQLHTLQKLADGTRTARELAAATHLRVGYVRRLATRYGLQVARAPRQTVDHAQVLRLADEGHSAREIAARLGCALRTVHAIAAGRLRCAGGEKIRPPIRAPGMVSVVRSGGCWVVVTSTTCDSEAEAREIERRYRASV